jgi:aromatic ring-opening dioxygenase LigB subunit
MTVVRGAVVPHAPILLPELASPEVATSAQNVRRAVESIDTGDVDAVVVVSPHGSRTGVYEKVAGSLGEFGIPGDERWWFGPPDLAQEITRAWARPTLDGSIDHGAFVALSLLGDFKGSVIATAFAEENATNSDAIDLIEALEGLDARLLVIASAHLSASLSARAPLTYRPESEEIETRAVEVLGADPEPLTELGSDLATRGGSCSASTLQLYGRLFSGSRSHLLAYEKPVGVGYPVAVAVPR